MEWVYPLSWSGMGRDEERVRGPSTVQTAWHRMGSSRELSGPSAGLLHTWGAYPVSSPPWAPGALLLDLACFAEGTIGTGHLWGREKRYGCLL